jgi:hypothetical protein
MTANPMAAGQITCHRSSSCQNPAIPTGVVFARVIAPVDSRLRLN